MPNMLIRAATPVQFSTTSDDFLALVTGSGNLEKRLKQGEMIPTLHTGLFVVIVSDRQLRTVSAKLEDRSPKPQSTPPVVERTGDELVTIVYEVTP